MGSSDSSEQQDCCRFRMPQINNIDQLYLEGVSQLYDTYIDLITFQDEADNCCETRINNLGELLDDSFLHCAGYDFCINKDTFLSDAKLLCNKYKEVEDFIEITQSSEFYGGGSISLSVKLVHLQKDGCRV